MSRKNTMRDNVNAIRSRLPYLSDLPREKIELALLYHESNVDETVAAFERNGAVEALGGWNEMNNDRRHMSGKRTNNRPNKPLTLSTTSSQISPSNGILRPSQRVSSIFQTFAEGGVPSPTTTIKTIVSSTCSPSSLSSSSFLEQSNSSVSLDSPTTVTVDTSQDSPNTSTTINAIIPEETTEVQKSTKSQRRKSIKNRNSSTSSIIQTHETSNNSQTTTTTAKGSNSITLSNNKKILAKSVKDLQRQTSTLANVELLFNNEIKASLKRIDDVFKQIHEILKEREVALYLEMDKAKEQGLNVIHRRQQRAIELRQRIDRCDRLEPSEIDNLRHDIKQFVTDRRYDLGEELTSAHRFDYEQSLVEALKHFGTVLTCDRKRSISTTSPLLETSTTTENSIVHTISENVPVANSRKPSISPSSNEVVSTNQQQQPMEQRIQHKTNKNDKRSNGEMIQSPTNENGTGDYHQNYYYSSQTNGYSNYYDDSYNYQNMNRRRLAQQYPSSASQRPRPLLDFQNGNYRRTTPKQINTRSNMYNNSETTTAYHRPRPSSQSIVPVQT